MDVPSGDLKVAQLAGRLFQMKANLPKRIRLGGSQAEEIERMGWDLLEMVADPLTARGVATGDLDLLYSVSQVRRGLRAQNEQGIENIWGGLLGVAEALNGYLKGSRIWKELGVKDLLTMLFEETDATQGEMAHLLGVGRRSIVRWRGDLGGQQWSRETEQRIRALARLVCQLRLNFDGPGMIGWLSTPMPSLQGRRPIDCLLDEKAMLILEKMATTAGRE